MKVLVVGRHEFDKNEYGIDDMDVVVENKTFFGVEIVLGFLIDAAGKFDKVIFQMSFPDLTMAIADICSNSKYYNALLGPLEIYLVKSVPGKRPAAKVFSREVTGKNNIKNAIDLIEFANPRALVMEKGSFIFVGVEQPMRFEFDKLLRLR
jgi:hypothetical protein